MAGRSWAVQQKLAPYLFLSPFGVIFCVFFAYPLGRSLVLSLYNTAGPRAQKFIGLHNYQFLLTDRVFWLACANTAAYTLAFLFLQIPIALLLALLLNSPRLRGRNIFRFCFFSTYLVGQVFVAVVFAILLDPQQGLLGRAMSAIGLPTIDFLSDPHFALAGTLLAGVWLATGFGMIYLLAALQGVDRDLYEAADVDGAGRWAAFAHITLPGVLPVLLFLVLMGTVGGFQLFELPYVLFQGAGPNYSVLTIVMYLFLTGFEGGNLGYASAIGWMLVFLIALFSLIQLFIIRRVMRK
jgi:ABC-type sugar transport system permease subunit